MEKVKIGYLGGCWDLFHIGHLNYIKTAKELCDYLVVDVTPDAIMYEQKKKYPVIGEKDRIEIIRALKYVDKAGLSDNKRDFGALEKYGFNVLFISEDHRGKEYYEDLEKKMKKCGVKVIYLPYTKNISSSLIRQELSKK